MDAAGAIHSRGIKWFSDQTKQPKEQEAPRQPVELKAAGNRQGTGPPDVTAERKAKQAQDQATIQAWQKASAQMPYSTYVEQQIKEAANSVEPEYFRTCIKMFKYIQNYIKQDLEIPIQKAMCDAWNAPKQDRERFENVMKAIIRHTRGAERTGAHAERHLRWGTDNYLHWKPIAAPWPEPLVHNRATPLEKQIAQTMLKAKQRMISNWDKQK